jgi:F-type H+-transporting ATPase subunit gamma
MEMVATAKIKRAQQRIEAARPYAFKMMEVLGDVAAGAGEEQHPLLAVHEPVASTMILALTSDRGLAGAFNSNVIRATEAIAARERAADSAVKLVVSGKKGLSYFKWVGYDIVREYRGISDRPSFEDAQAIGEFLIDAFKSNEADKVWLVFNRFKNAAEQQVTEHLLLPIERAAMAEAADNIDKAAAAEMIFEPSPDAVLESLLPTYIEALVYRALLESAASEFGARRTAMKSASDNANEMIDTLTRFFNRARQAQITQEIAEIVGGANALQEVG